jgi:cell division protein FtsB
MSDRLEAADMPRLDVLDDEFGQDPVELLRGRRRRILRRFGTLAVVALGLGGIAALIFAWSNADGRLRLELQSVTMTPRNVARGDAADEEADRLRRRVDALETEVKELTQAQQQAAHTIAILTASAEEARNHVPPPTYWYSNPAALHVVIASKPEQGVALPARRPTPPRRESRDGRERPEPQAAQ